MPEEIAVLGAYPTGLEAEDLSHFRDKWTCWRLENSVPLDIWRRAEPVLRGVIQRQGYFCVYPYWGHNAPVEYQLQVSDLRVFGTHEGAPGETFPIMAEQRAHAWLRYQRAKRLLHPIPRNRFLERPLTSSGFGPPQAITEAGWIQMWHTGVIFVELAAS